MTGATPFAPRRRRWGAGMDHPHPIAPYGQAVPMQYPTRKVTPNMATKAVSPVTGEISPASITTADVLRITRDGGKIRLHETDDAGQAFDIMAGKLSAESADDLFSDTSGNVLKTSEIVNRPFRLDSVEFRNSDLDAYPEGLGIFAVMHVTLDGQAETIIAGGADVVLKSMRAVELDALPRYLVITETATKSGRKVQNLVDASSQSPDAF